MAATIVTKNSSTAGAVPTSSDLVQGELAVNVTDKALYTENASGTVVKLNAPSIVDNGNATAITIDSSENVGIGTSSPNAKLEVFTTNEEIARFTRDLATDSALSVRADNEGSFLTTVNNHNFRVFTSGSERARIDTSGNLLVGTTSQFSTTSRLSISVAASSGQWGAAFKVDQVAGGTAASFLNSSSSQVGYIQLSNTATTYSTSSDYRLKENIAPMTGALSLVSQLKPCTYKWKADGSDGQGFIAHELQAVVPDCVTGEKDAVDSDGNPVYQGIDTSFLVATLTAAIQELKAELDAAKADIAALKGQA